MSEDQWRVEGGVALTELESALGHSFDRDDVSTVGGLVLAEFGRVPRVGESIDVEGYRLVVEHVVRRRVKRIAVHRQRVEATVAPRRRPADDLARDRSSGSRSPRSARPPARRSLP